jgi:hypothetical protein
VRIVKRTSHITVVVSDKKPARKAAKGAKEAK